jgi:hypothetical protein
MSDPGFAPPDLCSIRAAANRAELAGAVRGGLSADGYPLGDDDPPAPAGDIDRAIRLSTAAAVLAVAGIAAYVSYWHACAVVRAHGGTGITARLEPATIDDLVYASSMVNLYAARHRVPVPALARWLLALGIVATLAANMAQGWSHGPVGAIIAAWPAVSLVGSYELVVWIIRTAAAGGVDRGPATDHTGWCADHAAHGRPGASSPEATPDSGVAHVGIVPGCGNGPQVQTCGPEADQRSGPGNAAVPNLADQDTTQIRGRFWASRYRPR